MVLPISCATKLRYKSELTIDRHFSVGGNPESTGYGEIILRDNSDPTYGLPAL